MAFRFRRSVKLAKGVRLNVSKRGIGVSVGKRGLRQSFHSTGRKTSTIGIPGTGLSYVKTGKKKRRKHKHVQANQNVTDNQHIIEEYEDYLHAITTIHQQADEQIDWEIRSKVPAPFSQEEGGQREKEAVQAYENYTPGIMGRIFNSVAEKKKVELRKAITEAKNSDEAAFRAWEEKRRLAIKMMLGDETAYSEVVEHIRNFNELQSQNFTVHDEKTVEFECSIDMTNIVPENAFTLTKTGKISKRKMGVTKYQAYLKEHVASLAIWIGRQLFAHLPIETSVVHITENTLNTVTGYEEEQVLVSIRFDMETVSNLNIMQINPADALTNFPHHMDHLKTKGFRGVERLKVK